MCHTLGSNFTSNIDDAYDDMTRRDDDDDVSQYQKGKTRKVKPIWFTGARDSEWQWHQLGHMQICTSPQTDNHAPLSFYRPDALPAAQPTASKH